MSPVTKSRLRDLVVNALITATATLFLSGGVVGAWRAKETVADHDADINAIADVLCEMKPDAHACKRLGHTHASGEVAQR